MTPSWSTGLVTVSLRTGQDGMRVDSHEEAFLCGQHVLSLESRSAVEFPPHSQTTIRAAQTGNRKWLRQWSAAAFSGSSVSRWTGGRRSQPRSFSTCHLRCRTSSSNRPLPVLHPPTGSQTGCDLWKHFPTGVKNPKQLHVYDIQTCCLQRHRVVWWSL